MAFEDRFKLRLPLGEGDLGAVWDAEDQVQGVSVAVAMLEADAPEAVRKRFLEAAKVLKDLKHPNLVAVRDWGTADDGSAFLSMELLQGQTLLDRLSEGPALKIEQLVGTMIDVLEGLETLHAKGHVHGDIEPGNVVLVEEAGTLRAKLIGFGMNRASMRGGEVEEAGEESESALRSFACMSPEQARKETVADVKGDLYSFGAVLYDALTGKLPYRGTSLQEVREAVGTGGAKPVHEVRNELAGALAGAIDRAMSHKPPRRFADAASMRKALRAALIMSPKVKGLDVAIAPRKLERDSMVHPQVPQADAEAAPTDQMAQPPDADPVDAPTAIMDPETSRKAIAAALADDAPEARKDSPAITAKAAPAGKPAAVPAPAAKPSAVPPPAAAPGAMKSEAGAQRRVRTMKATMPGLAPPPAAIPAPATSVSSGGSGAGKSPATKKPATSPPKPAVSPKAVPRKPQAADAPDPAHASAFAEDESTQELSLDSIEVEPMAAGKPTPASPVAPKPSVPPPTPVDATEEDGGDEGAQDDAPPALVAPPAGIGGLPGVDLPARDGAVEPAVSASSPGLVEASSSAPPDLFAAPAPTLQPGLDTSSISLPAGGPPKKLLIGGGVAAAAVLLIVLIASGGDDAEDAAAVETAAPPQSAEVEEPEPVAAEPEPEPEPEVVPEPEPEPEPETILLTLTGVPEGASVTVDGEPVEGGELELPRDEATHEVQVEAEGFEPWTQSLSATEDRELVVEMTAVEEPEPEVERPTAVQRERPRVRQRPPRRNRVTRMRARVVRDPGF